MTSAIGTHVTYGTKKLIIISENIMQTPNVNIYSSVRFEGVKGTLYIAHRRHDGKIMNIVSLGKGWN